MAQATSGETVWAETHHMPVCNFPYWTGPNYGFRQPFCLQRNNERSFEKPLKCNEFSKLSTKSCIDHFDNGDRFLNRLSHYPL